VDPIIRILVTESVIHSALRILPAKASSDMVDAWTGNFPLVYKRVAEKSRVENKYRSLHDHVGEMPGW
jgi:hypothetical protein